MPSGQVNLSTLSPVYQLYMVKRRLLLIGVCALAVWGLFQLPKVVIENERNSMAADSAVSDVRSHIPVPPELSEGIGQLRREFSGSTEKEKNAIFADSLADLYALANQYDSAAWFAEEASKFFNTVESWTKAGDHYYQAYTLALNVDNQLAYATKAQEFYKRVLDRQPGNLDIKTKMAMTYLSSPSPMQGIMLLREVLAQDPRHELALFNMGMLSLQSGQHDRAIGYLEKLVEVNPSNIQGQLLLGLALMNHGDRLRAKEQFEKVKKMDKDPAVQATVDSYLEDLK